MSLSSQDRQKQVSIFKNSLKFQESAAGVVLQRITGSYLRRILKPLTQAREAAMRDAARRGLSEANILKAGDAVDPKDVEVDRSDPLVAAIYSFDTIFSECRTKQVDMLAGAESIVAEFDEYGAPGHGCLLLAWKIEYDTETRSHTAPKLVGAMTLHKFVKTSNFSTDDASISAEDMRILSGTHREGAPNYFRKNLMYIDGMCAKGKGVGRVLLLHAYRYALMRKCTGVIALSFSRTVNAVPESHKIFTAFGFTPIIPKAKFNVRMYGTWFYIDLDAVTFRMVVEDGIKICTRRGFTEATKNKLVWRCPN